MRLIFTNNHPSTDFDDYEFRLDTNPTGTGLALQPLTVQTCPTNNVYQYAHTFQDIPQVRDLSGGPPFQQSSFIITLRGCERGDGESMRVTFRKKSNRSYSFSMD